MNATSDPSRQIALKGHIAARNIHEDMLVAYWAKDTSYSYHMAGADRHFRELADLLGYRIIKVEDEQVAA